MKTNSKMMMTIENENYIKNEDNSKNEDMLKNYDNTKMSMASTKLLMTPQLDRHNKSDPKLEMLSAV